MMRPVDTVWVAVKERSHVALARQRVVRLARRQGFSEADLGKLALIASEAATNLLVHGGGGEFLAAVVKDHGWPWIHLLVTDQGPGIVALGRALAGGRSTGEVSSGKSLGEGLGAIQRLSDQFEIFAPPGAGTTIACGLRASNTSPGASLPKGDAPGTAEDPELAAGEIEVGGVCRPKRGETQCGDGWAVRRFRHGSALLLVIDGVGHGPAADEATQRALDVLAGFRRTEAGHLMAELHSELAGTRGAAGLAISVDPVASELRCCGIGNVSGVAILDGERRGLVSLNGTLGHGEVTLQEFVYPWPEGSSIIVHTDGLSSRWDLTDYPGLRLRHPSLIAGVLYRDHAYDHDDATVVAIRRPRT